MIVSNPPFSIKDDILRRLWELDKPYAVLFPLNDIQGKKRFEYLKDDIQLLAFDQRIGFHRMDSMDKAIEGNCFASAYFCKHVLPRDLILEHLEKYERPLMQ